MATGPATEALGAASGSRAPSMWVLRLRLLSLIVLGYLYLLLLVCLALGLTFVHFYFWGITIPFFILLVRSLRLRLKPPQGIRITREQAPQLFREVERLAAQLHFPAFHQTLVYDLFNAGVVQVPLLGLVGWNRSYLLVGLPLLSALTPEEFRSVLAHEFFHWFGGHGRIGNWMFRVSATWRELHLRINTTHPRGDFLLRGFARWYVPRLDRADSALSHAQEHGADQFAAEYAGRSFAARALVSISLKQRYLGSAFWPQFWLRARDLSEPPDDAFEKRADLLRQPFQRDWSKKTLDWLMRTGADGSPSHPSLASRLRELEEEPQLPGAVAESAAEFFLGPRLAACRGQLLQQWQKAARENWQQQHREFANARGQLAALEDKRSREPLPPGEMLEHAILVGYVRTEEEAAPLYEPLLEARAESADVQFYAGRNRLNRNDPSGVALVENAMQIDEEWIPKSCELIWGYFNAMAEMDRAGTYAERASRREQFIAQAEAQLPFLDADAVLMPHELSDEGIATLARVLGGFRQVRRAYAVRRYLRSLPRRRYYCVCVEWRTFSWVLNEQALIHKIASSISFSDGRGWFFPIGSDRQLRARLKEVSGSLVYKRPLFARWRKKS